MTMTTMTTMTMTTMTTTMTMTTMTTTTTTMTMTTMTMTTRRKPNSASCALTDYFAASGLTVGALGSGYASASLAT